MYQNRHHPLMVALRLLQHKLYHLFCYIDLRPIQEISVTKAKPRVDADQEQGLPFDSDLLLGFNQSLRFPLGHFPVRQARSHGPSNSSTGNFFPNRNTGFSIKQNGNTNSTRNAT